MVNSNRVQVGGGFDSNWGGQWPICTHCCRHCEPRPFDLPRKRRRKGFSSHGKRCIELFLIRTLAGMNATTLAALIHPYITSLKWKTAQSIRRESFHATDFRGKLLSRSYLSVLGEPRPKTPSTRTRFCLKTETFFLQFGFPPTRIRRKQSPKRIFSKTLSTVVIFKNAVLLYSCGRLKTEDFENDFVTVYWIQSSA